MTDWKVDTSLPVLVTGATGYVAGVLVKELLDAGLTVHAAVRDPTKEDRLSHLKEAAEKSPGNIKFFKGDLLDEGSYEEGMKGCGVVFHTASPFAFAVKDAYKDLIQPAVNGTRNVLNSASKCPTVKRVIVTSSCMAIFTDASDTYSAPNDVLTEEVWNQTATLTHNPYALSKTKAELAAWELAGAQNQWTLATINPGFVLGPGLKPGSGESWDFIKQLGDGSFANGVPNLCYPVVDVRDVAKAHVAAAYKPDAKGRHILSAGNYTYLQMTDTLRAKFGATYPLPSGKVPKLLLLALGPWINELLSRKFVWNNVDIAVNCDNTKSKEQLGIQYTPLETTMIDMFQQAIDTGLIPKKE